VDGRRFQEQLACPENESFATSVDVEFVVKEIRACCSAAFSTLVYELNLIFLKSGQVYITFGFVWLIKVIVFEHPAPCEDHAALVIEENTLLP